MDQKAGHRNHENEENEDQAEVAEHVDDYGNPLSDHEDQDEEHDWGWDSYDVEFDEEELQTMLTDYFEGKDG